MIKEALEYIVGLRAPVVKEIDESMYSDKDLKRISYNPLAEPLHLHTLTGLVDYIKSNVDTTKNDENLIVEVASPERVYLYTSLDKERKREQFAVVEARVPSFPFNTFIGHEEFIINVQSKFLYDNNSDRAKILSFAGTVEKGSVAEYSDDGVSQKATVKSGIISKEEKIVPNPVKLRPYRTFLEVEQPMSEFIFRMKDKDYGISCAVIEADGGAWINAATKNIKEYLEFELSEFKNILIIS